MSQYDELVQALFESQTGYDTALADLQPHRQKMQDVNSLRFRGLIPGMIEMAVDAFRRPGVERKHGEALKQAMAAARGVDDRQRELERFIAQQERISKEAEENAKAFQMQALYQGAGVDPGQSALLARGGKLPDQPKPTYRDFVESDGSTATYIMNPDGTKGRSVGTSKAAPKPDPVSPTDQFKTDDNLYEDFEPTWNQYLKTVTNFNQMDRAFNENVNGAGDVAMLYQFVRGLDPDSVVREGEVALANSAASVINQMKLRLEKVDQNRVLPDSMRDEIYGLMQSLKEISMQSYGTAARNAFGRAEGYGRDPAQVYGPEIVKAFSGSQEPAPQAAKPEAQKTVNGKVYVKIDGQWYEAGN